MFQLRHAVLYGLSPRQYHVFCATKQRGQRAGQRWGIRTSVQHMGATHRAKRSIVAARLLVSVCTGW